MLSSRFAEKINKRALVLLALVFLLLMGGFFVWKKFIVRADTVVFQDYGCVNNSTSKCYDLGSTKETTDNYFIYDSLVQGGSGTISGSKQDFSEPKVDSTVTYREILAQKSVYIKVPAFNFGSDSFANSPFIIQFRYKDTINPGTSTEFANRAVIKTDVNWNSRLDLDDNKYHGYSPYVVGGLGENGDSQWKTYTMLLDKTDWQMLRNIDGYYVFKIIMPSAGSENLPVDYISVNSVDPAVAQSFIEAQKTARNLRRVENPVSSNPIPSQSFVWYTTPSEKEVFPNTVPGADQIEKPIITFSSPGLTEAINFSVYSKINLANTTFTLNNLSSGGNIIPASNMVLKKVVYEERYWQYYGWNAPYGVQPGRLKNFSQIDIAANTSQQFYLMVDVPAGAKGGIYTGNISIVTTSGTKTIPISLEILSFALEESKAINFVYNRPGNNYSLDAYRDQVYDDMVKHGLDTHSFFPSLLKRDVSGNVLKDASGNVIFDLSLLEADLQIQKEKGTLHRGKAFYEELWPNIAAIKSALNLSGSLYEQLSDEKFRTNIGNLINQIQALGVKYNVELIYQLHDEPGVNLEARIYADRVYPLIRAKGAKTWVTYSDLANTTLNCTVQLCGSAVTQILSLSNKVDYKVWALNGFTGSDDQKSFYTTFFSHLRNPAYNRFLHGLFAVKTEADVVASWSYVFPEGDPFSDFITGYNLRTPYAYPDFMLIYPTWTGEIVPSVAWEAVREGIKDARYVATLQKLISENPNNPLAQEAQNYLSTTVNQLSENWKNDYVGTQTYNYGFAFKIIQSVSPTNSADDYEAFDKIRKQIFSYIKALKQPGLKFSANKQSVSSGGIVTYQIEFNNDTLAAAQNSSVYAPIPVAMEYVPGSASDNGSYDSVNKKISWNLGTMTIGATKTLTFQVMAK